MFKINLIKKIVLITTIIIIASVSILLLVHYNENLQLNEDIKQKTIHHSEFDGRITIENRCTENQSCYGFDKSGNKVTILCDDMPIHGGCEVENFDDYILQNDPAVKDCVPKVLGEVWTTQPYRNSTHSFDVEFCEWNLKIHHYQIEKDGEIFDISYTSEKGLVDSIEYITEPYYGLIVELTTNQEGDITITFPIGPESSFLKNYCEDNNALPNTEEFIYLVDGEEVALEVINTTPDSTTAKLHYGSNAKLIEIIVTCWV